MVKEEIEKYIRWIPAGGLLLILLSSLKHILFYDQFDINITEFIGISEYISIFMDDAIKYLLPLVLLYLFLLFLKEYSIKSIKKRFDKMSEEKKEKAITNNEMDLKTRKYGYTLLILSFIFLVAYKFYLKGFTNTTFLENRWLITLIITFIYFYLFNHSVKRDILIVIILSAIGSLLFGAFVESNNIRIGKEEFSYSANFTDHKSIKTDNKLKFIGKTNDFIYFFNLEKEESHVISTRNLDCIIKTRKIIERTITNIKGQ